MNDSLSLKRQVWLERAAEALRTRFDEAGYQCPSKIRVSCGFPRGGGTKGSKSIGQCWPVEVSEDGHFEIFISPEISNSVQVIGTIAHEMVHATAGLKCKHRGAFKTIATIVGLQGKMTSTVCGPDMERLASKLVSEIGEYPAGKMNVRGQKKQSTRMLKCSCQLCGYIARVTAKWIKSVGPPLCPTDHMILFCEDYDTGTIGRLHWEDGDVGTQRLDKTAITSKELEVEIHLDELTSANFL